MKRRNWTEEEQRIICRAYLFLLAEQAAGRTANKAALCRRILPTLDDRSRGSYELKMMNVSAALQTVRPNWPNVKGYKAAGHAQKSLAAILADEINRAFPNVYQHRYAAYPLDRAVYGPNAGN